MLPAAVSEADAVLIDGPYLSGRRRLFHRALRSWTDEPVIVSTRHVDDRVRRVHEQATAGSGEDPIVVDCVSAAHVDDPDGRERTRYAAGPDNLTDIGMTVTDVMESRRDDDLAIGIPTLSPLVVYTSVESTFQFTQVLINKAIGQGWPVVAATSSEIHDDPAHRALRQPFDVVIETRRGDVEGSGGGGSDGGGSDGGGSDAEGEADAAVDATETPEFRVRSREGISEWQPVPSP